MFQLDPDNLRIGRRTIKTSLAAGICVLLFHLLDRGTPMLACLATVFAMREDTTSSFYFGIRRVNATLLAGFLAVLLALIKQATGWNLFIDLFGVMLATIVFIALCNYLDLSAAIIGGMAAFLVIYFNIPSNENIIYAGQRLLDTFIGTLVAVGVNWVFSHKKDSMRERN